jgi:hypothetical protein
LEGTTSKNVPWNGRVLNKNYLGGRTYKTLYHERDFIPGELISENIKRRIKKSSRVLIILTPTLIKSDWCQEEFYFANLYEKAMFIRMKLNETEESDLLELLKLDANKPIDNHLKSHTYVKWNGLENDTDFWKSLSYSLPHKKAEIPTDSFVTLTKRMFRCRTRPSLGKENPLSAPLVTHDQQNSHQYIPNIVIDDFNETATNNTNETEFAIIDRTTDTYTQMTSVAFIKKTTYEEIRWERYIGEGAFGKVFRGKLKGQYVAIKKLHDNNQKGSVLHYYFICILEILKFIFQYISIRIGILSYRIYIQFHNIVNLYNFSE